MINIQEIAKNLFRQKNLPFKFLGGFLLAENLIAVVVKNETHNIQYVYVYRYKNGDWEATVCPKLSNFMDNLKDYLPAKQKFMVEVEVTTPDGERGPEEVFRNFCAKEMVNDDGSSFKFTIIN